MFNNPIILVSDTRKPAKCGTASNIQLKKNYSFQRRLKKAKALVINSAFQMDSQANLKSGINENL